MSRPCRCTLAPLASGDFRPAALRRLLGGTRSFRHPLGFTRGEVIRYRAQEADRLSISGVQDKVSLRLEDGELRPTTTDGEFILKPVPSLDILEHASSAPANEHLTMQIAGQLFGIPIPPCALVELADGEPAYLVRRFDRAADGARIPQEDFCQLSNRSEIHGGPHYKYDASLEETGQILRRYCAAPKPALLDLFTRHVFNYVFANGDAHLKNFSLQAGPQGDYLLSPAYDLLCTSLHLRNDSRCALDFFADDFETPFFQKNGFHGREDFLLLAKRFELPDRLALRVLDRFALQSQNVACLIHQSFLPPELQTRYLALHRDRILPLAERVPNRIHSLPKTPKPAHKDVEAQILKGGFDEIDGDM